MDIEPTEAERKAIAALKRLAKKWPKSLWLFSASGSLLVMRARQDGRHALDKFGSVDHEYTLDQIHGISNDGGDF